MSEIESPAEARRRAHEAERTADYRDGLLRERQGYVNRATMADEAGDDKEAGRMNSRVSQVDDELRRIGAEDSIPSDGPKRRSGRKAAAAPADDKGDGAGSGSGAS